MAPQQSESVFRLCPISHCSLSPTSFPFFFTNIYIYINIHLSIIYICNVKIDVSMSYFLEIFFRLSLLCTLSLEVATTVITSKSSSFLLTAFLRFVFSLSFFRFFRSFFLLFSRPCTQQNPDSFAPPLRGKVDDGMALADAFNFFLYKTKRKRGQKKNRNK